MLAKEIDTAYANALRISLGDSLQVLRPTLFTLGVVAAVKELNRTSSSLLIALSGAMIGFSKNESKLGVLPESAMQMSNHLAEEVLALTETVNGGSKHLLPLLLQLLTAASLVVPMMTLQYGGAEANTELLIHALMNGGVIESSAQTILVASGINEKKRNEAAQMITLYSLVLMILATSKQNREQAVRLSENFHEVLSTLLNNAIEFTSNSGELNLFLTQLKIALEQHNTEFFIDSILEKETISESLNQMQGFCRLLWEQFIQYQDDINTASGILQG